jgi:altronate hydrolase
MPATIRLHATDNVVVALAHLAPGTRLPEGQITRDPIRPGHKLAASAIQADEPIRKFGQVIGFARTDIAPGDWVHEHNVTIGASEIRLDETRPTHRPNTPINAPTTFQGYRRTDGRAGTRNMIGIVSSVNCSATVSRLIAREAERTGLIADHPGIDGIVPIVHGAGCGLATSGEAFDLLQRTLRGYATHPNFAAVLVIGLGCEVMQVPRLVASLPPGATGRVHSLVIQEQGGTTATVRAALDKLREILPTAAAAQRETLPVADLVLALQCGGSDGYSGLTANPALGAAADLLVSLGGTAILSETPEIYGAEHLLTRRAATPEIAAQLMARIDWWRAYTARLGAEMNNNPSPGNKAGGLTTILEKSLGAVAKAGTSTLQAVYDYADPVTAHGLVFMDTPGYDPVAATGQVAGGANILCFTTGRGSAFGCKPTPSIKLATSTDLYRRMPDDMDLDCGDILEGVSIEEKGAEIFTRIVQVASGQRTKSELLGYGDDEFIPWQLGAVM